MPPASSENSTQDRVIGPRNIWAVGRNYGDHAKELGHQAPAADSEPMVFLKAGSCVVNFDETFALPPFSTDVHHECEIALQFGANGQFRALTVALDLTARDLQTKLKANGHPWTLAKSFNASCPLGPLVPLTSNIDLQNLEFRLHVNGELRQHGFSREMIHPIEKLRQYVLARFPVEEGDLLLTGTPAGVARMNPGDVLLAEIVGLVKAQWRVKNA
jgi:2-keto-4-pentenoate hydratase/2-oxohepta-3-ene-1,7-dioic acid hydratase in catechol pathway